ncbi:hypothetical protein PCG10_001287 [Penicillium crustosum]|uniref:Uncharacterized protein n=1 Tax=Penicillium crustosum TaxID=36656 RepID=A0A9P5GD47_PENCR|nr:uncharacterized protein N7487_003959 [Penicillium crustosum]KAF7517370.1 hypothetical protein PCG10_001287 [Penicillium crustosum]KAJ5409600.1 hypothetical protein N7487_003959 [Penicillium crustosum]
MAGTRPKRLTPANQTQESATNRVILHEKPTLVKGVIDYLYTLDYKVELPPPATNLPQQPDGEKARDNQEMSTHMPEDAGAAWDILSFHILIECSSTGSRSSRRKTWQKSWRGRSTRGRSHMRSMKYTTQHPQVTETYETWQWELLWKTS